MFKLFNKYNKHKHNNTSKTYALDIIRDAIDHKSDYIFYSLEYDKHKQILVLPNKKFKKFLKIINDNYDDNLIDNKRNIRLLSLVATDVDYTLEEIIDALEANKF